MRKRLGRTHKACVRQPYAKPIKSKDDSKQLVTRRASGVCYYGFRYYNPSTGRWLSRDPIEENGGLNIYGMAGNNPINFLDMLGLSKFDSYPSQVYENCCVKWKSLYQKSIEKYGYFTKEYLKRKREELVIRLATGQYDLSPYDTNKKNAYFDANKAMIDANEEIFGRLFASGKGDREAISSAFGVVGNSLTVIESVYAYKEDGVNGVLSVAAAEARKNLIKALIKQIGKTVAIDLGRVSNAAFFMAAVADIGYSSAEIATHNENVLGKAQGYTQGAISGMENSIADMVLSEKIWGSLDCGKYGKIKDQ